MPGHEGEKIESLYVTELRQRLQQAEAERGLLVAFVQTVAWTQPEAYNTYIQPDFIDLFEGAKALLAKLAEGVAK